MFSFLTLDLFEPLSSLLKLSAYKAIRAFNKEVKTYCIWIITRAWFCVDFSLIQNVIEVQCVRGTRPC